jgi:DNA polymerase-3 subunit alpha
MDWSEIKKLAATKCIERKLSKEYIDRFKYEVKEIEKQGANQNWTDNYNAKKIWNENPNGLVLLWLLDMTPVDPVAAGIKHDIRYQTDFPDIDVDFLPNARNTVKIHAAQTYKHVCSVGNWITYKPKSALQDVTRALGRDLKEVVELTTHLPDEFDEETIDSLREYKRKSQDKSLKSEERADAHREVARYEIFYNWWELNKDVVDFAFRLVGKIKAQGTHAGGVIIADRPIENLIPLSLMGKKNEKVWTSQWTEGKNTQLSKFGLVKFDVLGVKTLYYIWYAGKLIEQNYGIKIDWSRMDPKANPPFAGIEIDSNNTERVILQNDPDALRICNELKTDSVFQIETDIQKGIISDGKVKDFWDLVVYNALGRPGPMDMIPEYIKRRDDQTKGWKNDVDPRITQILEETFNVIVYQEQLQTMWIRLAGFTVPEAEAARKVIAKKWADKLKKVEEQWIKGAVVNLGEAEARRWWDMMVTFGRYAFNRAHSVAYSIITYRCLYLKAHYPAEWWAAVMSECHSDKLKGYMSAARLDGVKFGNLDVNKLSFEYIVRDGNVLPGLKSIKGIGKKIGFNLYEKANNIQITSIDQAIEVFGKRKIVFERLIKLGAFDKIHQNRQGLWVWYQYKYIKDKDICTMINNHFSWSDRDLQTERDRQRREFYKLNPHKKKLPKHVEVKIGKWKPKIALSRDEVMTLFSDYTIEERLKIEKELLGYYWNSPLSIYQISGYTIERAKTTGVMEVVIDSIIRRKAKTTGNTFYVFKVTDGIQSCDVTIWQDVYRSTDEKVVKVGSGIKLRVDYNMDRKNFKIANRTEIIPLIKVGEVVIKPISDDEYPLL